MGQLVDGQWKASDTAIKGGRYVRDFSIISNAKGLALDLAAAADLRCLTLILSQSCPWSHRVALVRALKGLHEIPVHYAHGERVEGYALNGGAGLNLPGVARPLAHLHELYTEHDQTYTGRVTVPVLWDGSRRRILSNESTHLMIALDKLATGSDTPFRLYPPALARSIDTWTGWLYAGLNNAVYEAGFAQSQLAYDDAEARVFGALARLDAHLAGSRFLCGNVLTIADLQAWPTLARFDQIYHILFRCARHRLTDFPRVWSYARDIFAIPGVADTIDWTIAVNAAFQADSRPGQPPVIPHAAEADWSAPSMREETGPALALDHKGKARPLETLLWAQHDD